MIRKKVIAGLILLGVLLTAFTLSEPNVTIHSIGDSTMCDFDEKYLSKFGGSNYPIRGWMQMMKEFVTGNVTINNAARSGRSSKSFREEGHWQKMYSALKPGDYVFIMFGGNDQKPDSARHTEPFTSYKQNMKRYVEETKSKGAYPVLFTSIVRRKFDKQGKLVDTYGDYTLAVKDLAKEMRVPMVDLNLETGKLLQQYGPEESKKLFLYIEPGAFTALPQGKKDDSHLSVEGARAVAGLAVKGLKDIGLPLSKYLK